MKKEYNQREESISCCYNTLHNETVVELSKKLPNWLLELRLVEFSATHTEGASLLKWVKNKLRELLKDRSNLLFMI